MDFGEPYRLTEDAPFAGATCSYCGISHTEGYLCEETGETFCSETCLESSLSECGNAWRWDEEENESGGYITVIDGDTLWPLNIFYTTFYN